MASRMVYKYALFAVALISLYIVYMPESCKRTNLDVNKTAKATGKNQESSIKVSASASKQRAISTEKKCSKLSGAQMAKRYARQILVNDQYQLMFCYINKIASSNVQRLFLALGEIVHKQDLSNISAKEIHTNFRRVTVYSLLSERGRRNRLRRYKKVMITREPFERLISAYNSKFVSGIVERDPWSLEMAATVIGTLNLQPASQGAVINVTFANFIHYLIQQRRANESFDMHWATYTELCNPCHVRYDSIVKYESIDTDMRQILHEIGADKDIVFPRREHQYNTTVTSKALLEKYYSNVPPEDIKQLRQIYYTDEQLFDYPFPEVLKKFVGRL